MADYSRGEVNGVPVIWEESPGSLTASLTFRAGIVDEKLTSRGICHIVEHLALDHLRDSSHFFNGFVDLMRTSFVVRGDGSDVVECLRSISQALRELPMERLPSERSVLKAEAATRPRTALESFLSIRYGARGPGLLDYDELGLDRVTGPEAQSWADERFCSGNAVLWLTGPPPDDLTLDLQSGGAFAAPIPSPVGWQLPGWTESAFSGVGVSYAIDRSVAASLLAAYLDQEMRKALRFETALSYSPTCTYLPVSSTKAELTVWADCLPENAGKVMDSLRHVLEQVAQGSIDGGEVHRAKEMTLRAWADPQSAMARLDRSAIDLLNDQDMSNWTAEMRQIEGSNLTEIFKEVEVSALFLTPSETRVADVPRLPRYSTGPRPEGRSLKSTVSRKGREVHDLVLFDEGISYGFGDGQHLTIRYDECEALLRWDDDFHALIGADGSSLTYHHDEWKEGGVVLAAFREHLGEVTIRRRDTSPLRQMRGETSRDTSALQSSGEGAWNSSGIPNWALVVAAFLAVRGASVAFNSQTDGRVLGLALAIVCVLFLAVALYLRRR